MPCDALSVLVLTATNTVNIPISASRSADIITARRQKLYLRRSAGEEKCPRALLCSRATRRPVPLSGRHWLERLFFIVLFPFRNNIPARAC
jgi:hypothetical protein